MPPAFPRDWHVLPADILTRINSPSGRVTLELKPSDLLVNRGPELRAMAQQIADALCRPPMRTEAARHRRTRFYIELWHRDEPGAHDHNVPQVSTEADLDGLTADAGSRLIAMMIAAALETGRDLAYQGRSPTGGAGMWKLVKGHLIEYLSNGRIAEDDPVRKLIVE